MDSSEVKVPADIVYEIFIRLPVKSLMRFRSISKSWRDIIDGSLRFANMHMSTRLAAADEPQLLPLCNYIDAFDRKRRAALTFDGNIIKESDCPSPILDYSKRDHYYVFVEFVAYGLLLLQDCWAGRNKLFLCNPLRGEVLELPKPLQDCSKDFLLPRSLTSYGIGFDSATNSYKIVRLGREPRNNLEIEVYTLGTHSWRHASPSSIRRSNNKLQLQCLSEFGLSAYGDMHWKNWEFGSDHEARIISFDFKNEQLNETPLPDFECQGKHYRRFRLINLRGFLAVVSFQSDRHIEIWMLKDYYEKVKETWVREYRISTQVWARGSDPDHNGLFRAADISFWRERQQFEIGVSSRGLLFVEALGRQVFVLDLERNCLWHLDCPQSYNFFKKITTIFSYTGGVFSLRQFGNPIAKKPQKYNFLKTVHRVFVSP